MLVLSRKLNEKLILITAAGERIVIAPADIDRGKVRLAVDAPKSVQIWREEILPAHLRTNVA